MSESMFRLSIVILLAILVIGGLGIGYRATEVNAQNGRFVQFDLSKASLPSGAATVHQYESWVIDTRTGQVVIGHDPRNITTAK